MTSLTIHRKTIAITDQQSFVPGGFVRRVLAAANPRDPGLVNLRLDLWYETYPGPAYKSIVTVTIVGTGNLLPQSPIGDHVNTVITPSGLVWHVYARIDEAGDQQ